jgi:integration host factor subunit beta
MILPFLHILNRSPLEKTAMNKSELIKALTEKVGLKDEAAANILNLFLEGFTNTLKKDGRIEIRGFGVFTVRHYGSYTGRNPRTGKSVKVGRRKMPFFKVGRELLERLNGR